jgi:hypothetical protein
MLPQQKRKMRGRPRKNPLLSMEQKDATKYKIIQTSKCWTLNNIINKSNDMINIIFSTSNKIRNLFSKS